VTNTENIVLTGPDKGDTTVRTLDNKWVFMVEGDHGLKPMVVDGKIPAFATEEQATGWLLA